MDCSSAAFPAVLSLISNVPTPTAVNGKRSTPAPIPPTSAYAQFTFPELFCNAVNNAENDLLAEFFALYSSVYSGSYVDGNVEYFSAAYNFTAAFVRDTYGPSGTQLINYIDRVRSCISLDQSALCSAFCPEYGKYEGDFPCTDTLIKVLNTCSFGYTKKRAVGAFGYGLELALYSSFVTGGGQGSAWTQILAEWKMKGYEPRCYDPFKIKASDRFQVESGLFTKSICDLVGSLFSRLVNISFLSDSLPFLSQTLRSPTCAVASALSFSTTAITAVAASTSALLPTPFAVRASAIISAIKLDWLALP